MMTFPPDHFAGKRVTVMGLGHFGGQIAAIRFLVSQGAQVTVTDVAPEEKLGTSIAQVRHLPVILHLGGHVESDFTDTDMVVVSPAVPKDSRYLKLASERQIALTCEMNLFLDRCRAEVIGVTGSAGKSTTVSMLATILEEAQATDLPKLGYRKLWMGGNIGKSLLENVAQIQANDLVVLELSSFQLQDMAGIEYSPHVAIVTNVFPNHLDRHDGFQDYVESKGNITRYQSANDYLILNNDSDTSVFEQIAPGEVKIHRFGAYSDDRSESSGPLLVSLVCQQGQWELHYHLGDSKGCIIAGDQMPVPGFHNLQNAAAASAGALIVGVSSDTIGSALKKFKGLPDRLELVAEIDRIRWYNDSKSTTPQSGIIALKSFAPRSVIAIAGGYDKSLDLSDFARMLAHHAKFTLSLGQTGPQLAGLIRQYGGDVMETGSLDEAVQHAGQFAQAGDHVLLSPGCASWDMFENYQARGQRFRSLVSKLGKTVSINN